MVPSGDRALCASLSLKECPVYWITLPKKNGADIPYLQSIAVSEIENQFVSKYLKGMEVRRTDHKFYKIDNGAEIKIPNNHSKNLKPWEFKNIIFTKINWCYRNTKKNKIIIFIWQFRKI